MNISVYSFTAVAKRAEPLMAPGGSLLTLTYYGAREIRAELQRHGRRQGGARGFGALPRGRPRQGASASTPSRPAPSRPSPRPAFPACATCCTGRKPTPPLRRNVDIDDVGSAGLYLLSDLSSGVTGEIQYVDAGFNVVGMKLMDEDAPAETAAQPPETDHGRSAIWPELFFVRHGQTDWNAEGPLPGLAGIFRSTTSAAARPPRTARCCSTLLERDGPRPTISPGMCRRWAARAKPWSVMRAQIGAPLPDVTIDPRLIEISFGIYEGRLHTELAAATWRSPANATPSFWYFRPPQGESYDDLARRVTDFGAALTGPSIIVAHGGLLRVLRALIEGFPHERAVNWFPPQDSVVHFLERHVGASIRPARAGTIDVHRIPALCLVHQFTEAKNRMNQILPARSRPIRAVSIQLTSRRIRMAAVRRPPRARPVAVAATTARVVRRTAFRRSAWEQMLCTAFDDLDISSRRFASSQRADRPRSRSMSYELRFDRHTRRRRLEPASGRRCRASSSECSCGGRSIAPRVPFSTAARRRGHLDKIKPPRRRRIASGY